MADHPRKAYSVQYRVVNVIEARVFADSVADARRRWADNQVVWEENTGQDSRLAGVKIKRVPGEDLDA